MRPIESTTIPMKKKVSLVLLGLLIIALLAWSFMPKPLEVETGKAVKGRFERAVQEDGKTRLRERFVVSTPLAGRVVRIPLKQGDAVERNAVVAIVLPAAPTLLDERARAEQEARVGSALAAVGKARANVERASAALEQARTELERSEALARQGFLSPNQNETGRLSVRLRDKELDSARQEEAAAQHELERARITLRQSATTSLPAPQRSFEVRAPVSGMVIKLWQQSEATVAAGTPLLELGDPAQLDVVVDVLTEDAASMQPGTPVELSNWGGLTVLEGRVRLIEPGAFTKVSALGVEEQRVNVMIDITSPASQWHRLGDGFKVDVRIRVQVEDNVVKVPVSAVFPLDGGNGLFVLSGGRARLQPVEVGARNGVEAWVKAGLSEGSTVIVYPGNQLKEGERVKERLMKVH